MKNAVGANNYSPFFVGAFVGAQKHTPAKWVKKMSTLKTKRTSFPRTSTSSVTKRESFHNEDSCFRRNDDRVEMGEKNESVGANNYSPFFIY